MKAMMAAMMIALAVCFTGCSDDGGGAEETPTEEVENGDDE